MPGACLPPPLGAASFGALEAASRGAALFLFGTKVAHGVWMRLRPHVRQQRFKDRRVNLVHVTASGRSTVGELFERVAQILPNVRERCIGGVLTFGRRRFAELAAIGRGRQRDEVTAQYQPSREPSPESST